MAKTPSKPRARGKSEAAKAAAAKLRREPRQVAAADRRISR